MPSECIFSSLVYLVIVPKTPITIGTMVTFMFHGFFISLSRSRYLSLFSHSFSFILCSAGTAKSKILQILFFCLLIIIKSSLMAVIRWSVRMSKESFSSQRQLMGYNSSLSDSKSTQVSRTLLSIPHYLPNSVICIISNCLTFKSSSHVINPLVVVQRAQMIIVIFVTFMFHSFCLWFSTVHSGLCVYHFF